MIVSLALVASQGVCCADDAFFATVAKNLAWGSGYSTSLDIFGPHFALKPFDVSISTGPTLVLPVSAVVRLLGNRFWVPGVVHVAVWAVLLLAVWRALGFVASRGRVAVVGVVFLVVVWAMSPYHFEHWYAMLGEVPAALTLLLGLTIWAVEPGSTRRSLVAAVLWSLAVLTKMLALIYAVTFLGAAVGLALLGPCRGRSWRLVGALLCGFALPIVVFEAWTAASLGTERYLIHLLALTELLHGQGASRVVLSPEEIIGRLNAFFERFGVSLPGLVIVASVSGLLVWRRGTGAFKRLHCVALAGVILHVCYWLFLSLGWPRYFYIGIIVLSALIAQPYFVLVRPAATLLYSALLALSLVGTVGRLHASIADVWAIWSRPSAVRSNQDRVVEFLDGRLDRRPFAAEWWASVADLEYLSRGVLNFKGYTAFTPADLRRGALLVTNSRFDSAGNKQFASFAASCGQPVLVANPYTVRECGGANRSPTQEARVEDAATRVVATASTPSDIQVSLLVATTSCNVEHIGGQPARFLVSLNRAEPVQLEGWIVDEHDHRVPVRPYAVFESVHTGARWYAGLAVGLPRPDVARAKRREAYLASGFSVPIDTSALPPGEYQVMLVFRDAGPTFVCDNSRRLVLR